MLYVTEKQAEGIAKGKMMRIVCGFDIETWEDIRARAVRKRISVAEEIRRLCEIGLEEEKT